MHESSPKRLNSLCKTFQPWEVSSYESFCLEFEQLFPQASWSLFSDQGDRFPFHYFTCSNKSCPLPHMTALLLLRLCTPRHHFSVCGMDGMRGCRKKGEGRAWRRNPSGLPADTPWRWPKYLPEGTGSNGCLLQRDPFCWLNVTITALVTLIIFDQLQIMNSNCCLPVHTPGYGANVSPIHVLHKQ